MLVEGVIFDLDGTLIDSIDAIIDALSDALSTFGVKGNLDKAANLIGLNPWKIIGEITGINNFEEQDKIVQLWAKNYLKAILEENKVPLFPETIEVLSVLKNWGYKIGIASSLTRSIIEKLLSFYKIEPYIDAYVGNDEVKRSKPAPDIFIETARRLQVPGDRCLVVGDAEADIAGGKAMGAITVLFNPRNNQYNYDIKPDFEINSLRQILDILKK